MFISPAERALLDDPRHRLLAGTLRRQQAVGEFFDAGRFVEVSHAHAHVDFEVMGEAGLTFLEGLASERTVVSVPTSRNPISVCAGYEQAFGIPGSVVDQETKVEQLLHAIGVEPLNSCVPYEVGYRPHAGEHVAWGDTGAVAYANGVLGARTNFEGGVAALWAALTGRTAEFGFHLAENRLATCVCEIDATTESTADWSALGAMIGERCRGYSNVPVLRLHPASSRPGGPQLKAFAAAVASLGSIAMFHIVGVTPEAETLQQASGGRRLPKFKISSADVSAWHSRWPATDRLDLVVFSAPQLSAEQLRELSAMIDGRRFAKSVQVVVTTSRQALSEAGPDVVGRLSAAGAQVLAGVCWYLMQSWIPRGELGWRSIVTDSAKLANIVPTGGYAPIFRDTRTCVEAAVAGRML